MGEIYNEFMDFVKKPAVAETLIDLLLCTVPIWVAVMIGLVIGWSWRPRWTGLVFLGLRGRFRFIWAAPLGFGARRLWFAFTALSAFSVGRRLWSNFRKKERESAEAEASSAGGLRVLRSSSLGDISSNLSTGGAAPDGDKDALTQKDLQHLLDLLDGEEIPWQNQMQRATSNMTYRAWRYEPEVGPIVFRSKTIFEDATPELVRDFFWDDEFRCKWDNMLAYYKILEESPDTGTMIVHWIKKFPFFCSDREYIIGRRIWESGKTYYCVTKAVPYPSIPKNEKPRRVELYFSSWRIRAVESKRDDGQLSAACEVSLVHYEDMGIPKDVAKMGVRHGMWGAVKKLHSGLRAYQLMRKTTDTPLSRCAMMARITTKVSIGSVADSQDSEDSSEAAAVAVDDDRRQCHGFDWKWVILGGVAVACGLQSGIVGKALVFGAARRLARG